MVAELELLVLVIRVEDFAHGAARGGQELGWRGGEGTLSPEHNVGKVAIERERGWRGGTGARLTSTLATHTGSSQHSLDGGGGSIGTPDVAAARAASIRSGSMAMDNAAWLGGMPFQALSSSTCMRMRMQDCVTVPQCWFETMHKDALDGGRCCHVALPTLALTCTAPRLLECTGLRARLGRGKAP